MSRLFNTSGFRFFKGNSMKIEKIEVKKLNPAKYNPRVELKPGDPEYEKLKRSIKEFGYVELIVWNEQTGNISIEFTGNGELSFT
jgi:ParB-like chromosome segregation protein Spo0J